MTPVSIITFAGEAKPITEWALDYGITPRIIIARLERGEAVEAAITTPMKIGHPGQQLPTFHKQQRKKSRRVLHVYRPINASAQSSKSPAKSKRLMRNSVFEHNGESRTINEWAALLGIPAGTIRYRLYRDWPLHEALGLPRRVPGVPSNFASFEGTGAGAVLQETPNITFSQEAKS